MILDGGLATELEARGCDLHDDLWSARVLLEEPDLIRRVHLDYLRSGADCVVSASYQATFEGFKRRRLSTEDAKRLLRRSVELARQARDFFWEEEPPETQRLEPLVAASVGPYGAYLADGSEFRGDYDLDQRGLEDFHRDRWQVLAGSQADLLACETLPSWPEARALRRLLERTDGAVAWFSFSCDSPTSLCDGSPIARVVEELEDCSQIVAIGVNCTPPVYISGLIDEVRQATAKPIVVYPNAGERWDSASGTWQPRSASQLPWSAQCADWLERGARLIGGCCRTTPEDIARLRECCVPPTS